MLKTIREIVGESKVFTSEAIGADYCHDECPGVSGTPAAVVEVANTEQAAAVVKCCSEAGFPVTVRGAGTGQVGGSVPIEGGIVLSTKGMDQILSFDEANRTLRVQAGVLLQDVKAEAEKHGLYYPPDPGEKTATIGGNAATNASGPCAVKYGTTRDYVAALTVVRADGTVEILSGSALADVIGSEGTLLVITELTLKLTEKPKADAILLFPFVDTQTCLNAANILLEKDYAPAVVEYMDTDLVEFSGSITGNPVFPVVMDGERVGATLMLTIEGEDDDITMEKMEEIAELAEELECLDILVGDTTTMKREFWAAHAAFHTSMESSEKYTVEYNISVSADKIAEMVEYAKAEGKTKGMDVMAYAHVGSGGMHIHALSDSTKEVFAASAAELAALVYGKCEELGGSIAGEYGIGYAKKQYLSATAQEKFNALKEKYDSKGILNPGKAANHA